MMLGIGLKAKSFALGLGADIGLDAFLCDMWWLHPWSWYVIFFNGYL